MNILDTLKQLRDDLKLWVTNNLVALDEKIESKTIPIDNKLDTTSTNPVQNKVIAEEINQISDDISDVSNAVANIADDGSGEFNIADPSGNVIMKVNDSGIHTTDIEVNKTSIKNKIPIWDNKSEFSGDYNDLKNKPNITDDGSGEFVVADKDGNIVFKVNEEGLNSIAVSINGEKLEPISDEQILSLFNEDLVTVIHKVDTADSTMYNISTLNYSTKENNSGGITYAMIGEIE